MDSQCGEMSGEAGRRKESGTKRTALKFQMCSQQQAKIVAQEARLKTHEKEQKLVSYLAKLLRLLEFFFVLMGNLRHFGF